MNGSQKCCIFDDNKDTRPIISQVQSPTCKQLPKNDARASSFSQPNKNPRAKLAAKPPTLQGLFL